VSEDEPGRSAQREVSDCVLRCLPIRPTALERSLYGSSPFHTETSTPSDLDGVLGGARKESLGLARIRRAFICTSPFEISVGSGGDRSVGEREKVHQKGEKQLGFGP